MRLETASEQRERGGRGRRRRLVRLRWKGEWGEIQEQEVSWDKLDRGAGRGALDEAVELWQALSPAERGEGSAVGPAAQRTTAGLRRSARLQRGAGSEDVAQGITDKSSGESDSGDSAYVSGLDSESEDEGD